MVHFAHLWRGGSPFTDPRLQGFATGLLMRKQSAGGEDGGITRRHKTLEWSGVQAERISEVANLMTWKKDTWFEIMTDDTCGTM